MSIGLVISERRRALGFTQERIAEYLHVSVPAVSKWERGIASPDISLLAPLARLLKTDVNTLLSFHEDISREEINLLCQEITELVGEKGIAGGFEAARQRLHEYPYSEELLQCLTFLLDGQLSISGMSGGQRRPYDETLLSWYRRLAESGDIKIRSSAEFMLVSRLIREGDYDKAQEALDKMPDREDVVSAMADKRMLQVSVYLQQGRAEKAAELLQNALLGEINKVFLLLSRMVDAELLAGERAAAERAADTACRMQTLFDLWEYNAFLPMLQLAGADRDADRCICILREMLAAMLVPWDMTGSPLYCRIAKREDAKGDSQKSMLSVVLSALEKDPEYDFLREHAEFQDLIAAYREQAKE